MSWPVVLLVCVLVFFASMVDAIGGGGGLISLPTYFAVLPGSSEFALGSNKFSASFGTLTAALRFIKGGRVRLWPALLSALGAFPASYCGAMLAQHVSETFRKGFALVAVPVVAAVFFIKRDAPEHSRPMTKFGLFLCFAIGAACGFYDGFFGPGTGMFLIMLFCWAVGMDMVSASGTAKIANLASNLAALVAFVLNGFVVFQLAVPAMCCSILGGYVGARLALKNGAKLIRAMMIIVILALIIKQLYDFAKLLGWLPAWMDVPFL